MNVLGIAAFTPQGRVIADALTAGFSGEYVIVRFENGLRDWCRELFASGAAGIIFVGACGIAVRAVAPFLKSKTTDPAVLVADEGGSHVISLLSGHIGGANRLTRQAAAILQAEPVITTGTDVQGRFAVDVFATDNDLVIENMESAKAISAAVLRNEKIGFYCERSIHGRVPPDLTQIKTAAANVPDALAGLVCVSEAAPEKLFPGESLPAVVLHLIPRCLILGIGCKRGKTSEEIEICVAHALGELSLPADAVSGVASADLKRDEPGLLKFCEAHFLPFRTFSAKELMTVPGVFSSSSFVQEVTGADNICERAALCMADGDGRLILGKQVENGVTVAVAARDWSVSFEE